MDRCFRLLAAASVLATPPAQAADTQVGVWAVHSEKDPFSPKKKTIALTASSSDGALAIRCLGDDGFSVIVLMGGDKTFDAGTMVHFKYRADDGDIVEARGEAFGEHTIEMPNGRQILADAEKAGTLFVRMQTPTNSTLDLQFKTRGASKALAQIETDCPVEPNKEGSKDEKPGK